MTPHGAPGEATSNRPYRTRPPLGPLGAAACVVALASALMAGPAAALLSPDTSATHPLQQTPPKGPPNVRLSTGSVNLALHPYSSCWSTGHSGMCYDGMPPRPLPSVGGTDGPIGLAFARDRWRFRVSVTDEEGDRSNVDLVRTSPRHWRLALGALPDGRYRADVFGRGPQGDVAAAFAFTLN